MKPPPIPPAGPLGHGEEPPDEDIARLTALALGELSATEAAALEATIWRDTEARLELAKIRELAENLTFAYAAEPPTTLTLSQQRAILERQPSLTGTDEKEERLTAYALGELRPSQAEILSARLREDRAATLELEAVGALAARLRAAFAEEQLPPLTLVQRQAILDHRPDLFLPAVTAAAVSDPFSTAAPPVERRQTSAPTGRLRPWVRSAAIAAGFAALGYLASTHEHPEHSVAVSVPPPPSPAPADAFFPPVPPAANPESPQLVALLDQEKRRPSARAALASAAPITAAPALSESEVSAGATTAAAPPATRRQPDPSLLPPARTALTAAGSNAPNAPDTVLHTHLSSPGTESLTGFLASSDVHTATLPTDLGRSGYDVVRQCIRDFGTLPPAALVRPEEIINQFDYNVQPAPGQDFAVDVDAADCPWNTSHQLVRVTVAARDEETSQPPLRLTVFLRLADTPESERTQLLAWQGLQSLASRLGKDDSVSLVVWGRARGLVLPATTAAAAIDNLREASTRWHHGGSGHPTNDWLTVEQSLFQQAGDNARNLCLVLTDGPLDFAGFPLEEAVQRLRPLGFEVAVAELGPLRPESRAAQIADFATTPFYRADSGPEASRLLAQEMLASRTPVAEDVRVQVAFNPSALAAWRPVGFSAGGQHGAESPHPASRASWNPGRQLTALYEVVPAVGPQAAIFASPALPGSPPSPPSPKATAPLSVRLQYRVPRSTTVHTLTTDWTASASAWRTASPDFRLAAGAAAFSLRLQHDPALSTFPLDRISRWVRTAAETRDPYGLRREFAGMLEAAEQLEKNAAY
jgi:Ca-activated chloride channel family protein